MNSKKARSDSTSRTPSDAAPHPKRFRIEKLEERIAPKKGGKGTNNCGSVGTSFSGGTSSIY